VEYLTFPIIFTDFEERNPFPESEPPEPVEAVEPDVDLAARPRGRAGARARPGAGVVDDGEGPGRRVSRRR